MKKNISPSSVTMACLLFTASVAGSAQAADVNLSFTGRVLAGSCTVDVASVNQTIALGEFTADSFATVGAATPWRNFSVKLSSCPSTLTGIDFKLNGTADASNNNYLALTPGAGAAAGIAVQITRSGADPSTALSPGGGADSWTGLGNYNRDYTYASRYVRVGPVKSGTANANATFTISYR